MQISEHAKRAAKAVTMCYMPKPGYVEECVQLAIDAALAERLEEVLAEESAKQAARIAELERELCHNEAEQDMLDRPHAYGT